VVLTYRQTEKAEDIAKLAGTERVTEGGADYDTDNTLKHQGVARRQHAFKVNPQTLRTLGLGEFVLICAGRYAKVAATLSGLAYRLPDSAAVHQARQAIEDARLARTLAVGHSGDTRKPGDEPPPAARQRVLF